MLLNDRFVQKRSETIAKRLIQQSVDESPRVQQLWNLIYQREPTQDEQTVLTEFLQKQTEAQRSQLSAWTSVVRSILNSNECLYVE